MAENVFILGAGFSAPAGAPLIYNFVPLAKKLYLENDDMLRQDDYFNYFHKVFLYKEYLKKVSATFHEDLDDIEKLYSYCDFECRYINASPDKTEIRRSLIFMIIKTIDILTGKTILLGSNLNPKWGIVKEYVRLGKLVPGNFNIYDKFALLLSGKFDSVPCNSSVITFNYDIILDNACLKQGIEPYYFVPDQSQPEISLKILKLHGSANWMTCSNPKCDEKFEQLIRIKRGDKLLHEYKTETCPTCNQQKLMPLIVPPSWDKTQFKDVLGRIWNEAGKELKEARRIFIMGYSLPEVDLYFRYLLYTTLSYNEKDPEIFVIDWGEGASKVINRLKEIFSPIFYERHIQEQFSHRGIEDFINSHLSYSLFNYFKPTK